MNNDEDFKDDLEQIKAENDRKFHQELAPLAIKDIKQTIKQGKKPETRLVADKIVVDYIKKAEVVPPQQFVKIDEIRNYMIQGTEKSGLSTLSEESD